MKRLALALLAFVFLFASIVNVQAKTTKRNVSDKEMEDNLLVTLNTDNINTRAMSAYSLGEIKSSKALIPLLNILHNEKQEELRIVAALSLIKIGNEIGVYQVKQAVRFDNSPRVRRMCEIFYNAYVNDKVN